MMNEKWHVFFPVHLFLNIVNFLIIAMGQIIHPLSTFASPLTNISPYRMSNTNKKYYFGNLVNTQLYVTRATVNKETRCDKIIVAMIRLLTMYFIQAKDIYV